MKLLYVDLLRIIFLRKSRGGGGGRVSAEFWVSREEPSALRSIPLPFCTRLWQKKYPFHIHFMERRYSFHIRSWERCISFVNSSNEVHEWHYGRKRSITRRVVNSFMQFPFHAIRTDFSTLSYIYLNLYYPYPFLKAPLSGAVSVYEFFWRTPLHLPWRLKCFFFFSPKNIVLFWTPTDF